MTLGNHETSSPAFRLTLLSLVVVGLLIALFSRLWFLQVLASERYAQLAERNRVRFVLSEAPRGRILDRDGQEIVKNRLALTVSAYPHRLLEGGEPKDPEAAAVLARLSNLLGMPEGEIIARLTNRKFSPFRAVPIKEDVPPEVIFTIEERKELYSGVEAETLPLRAYPQGPLASQVVGYIGEVTEEQLADPRFRNYRPGDLVGRSGLEQAYEENLQGQEGLRKLEVSATGTILDMLEHRNPTPGADLKTSIDLELQKAVEEVLRSGIVASRSIPRDDGRPITSVAGSAVVLDPKTGQVLAMSSWPTYDPNVFVGGIRNEDWARLSDPANEYPLLNRAIQSAYPPGSTFKIVSGLSAMQSGLLTSDTQLPCPPSWKLGNQTFRNWWPSWEGSLDLSRALMRSCDTFFYQLAFDQWQREEEQEKANQPIDEAIQRTAREFGLGRGLGIDLPGEAAGNVPDRAWRRATWESLRPRYCRRAGLAPPGSYQQRLFEDLCRYGGNWRGGDAVNMSIGQGDVLVTPLQLATAFAAVANGGTLYRPYLGLEVTAPDGSTVRRSEPEVLGRVAMTPQQLLEIREGLRMVVMEPRGTAAVPFNRFPLGAIPVAGKTGTAEFGNRVPFAWFAAYAPTNDPKYVVVVSVEEGGGGSVTAAPIARRIFEAAFGLPISPFRAGPSTD